MFSDANAHTAINDLSILFLPSYYLFDKKLLARRPRLRTEGQILGRSRRIETRDRLGLKRGRLRRMVLVCYGMKPAPDASGEAHGKARSRPVWSWSVMSIPPNCRSDSDQMAVREELDRILRSSPFHASKRRQRFLEYIISETLAGRGERLKGYTIAREVFDRPETFDPLLDPVVRIEAGRLREKLREYYTGDGQNDPIFIDLPKGSYTPKIEFRHSVPPPTETVPEEAGPHGQRPTSLAVTDAQNTEGGSSEAGGLRTGIRPEKSQNSAPLGASWTFLAMLAAAALLAGAAGLWGLMARNSGFSQFDKPSIAVVPFENIGDDPKWIRFAEGMTDDIITDLSHSRDFIVIARNSAESYKAKPIDVRQIGRDLGVKYVLEGSIQSMGERIRVNAKLIEAATGNQVWSERYDRPVDDLFAVQNEVTERIAATLGGYEGAVAEAERQLVRRKPPANLTAFDNYLLGMEAKHRVTKDSLIEAEALFHKALALDPQLARAYVGLVDVYFYLIDLGLAPSVEVARSKQMEAAKKAVQLDPNDGKTHLALGITYAYHGKLEQASAEIAKAENLAPSDADVLLIIAWTIPALGETSRAVSLAEQALRLNPRYPDWYNQGLSYVFFFGEQYEKSVKYRLLVKEPLALDYAFLAMAYAYLGRTGEAETAAASVRKLDPTWTAERYLSEGGGYAHKEAELFVDGARKAGLTACVPVGNLKDMPSLIHVNSCDQQRAKASG